MTIRLLAGLCLAALCATLAIAQTSTPTVSWTLSASGPAPATVTIEVTVAAAGGTVRAVECFSGETSIGVTQDAVSPGVYRMAWTNVPAGVQPVHCTVPVDPPTQYVTAPVTTITVVEPETYSNYPRITNWGEVAAGYVGSFRVPAGPNGLLNYSGYGLTMGSDDTLFLVRDANVGGGFYGAEIRIPANIAPCPNLGTCAVATLVQQPIDLWEGKFTQLISPTSTALSAGHTRLWGLLAVDSQLCMVGGIDYDASNGGKFSAYCRSRTLAERGTVSNAMHFGDGNDYTYPYQGKVITDEKAGYTFGYMGWIPQEWRAVLDADACAGGTGKNITFRTSQGPSLTCFRTADLVKRQPTVPAQFLLNYPYEQRELGERMLGIWQSSTLPAATAWFPEYEANGFTPVKNPDGTFKLAMPLKPLSQQYGSLWNGTGKINGFAWPNKSRTILNIFAMGLGEWCYKDCPTHPARPTTTRPDGTTVIGGHHAEPDSFRAFFYDALDLVKVKDGQLKPWQVLPYHVENITLPGPRQRELSIRGITHNPRTNKLYVSQYVDTWTQGGGYVDSPPVIHVYQLK